MTNEAPRDFYHGKQTACVKATWNQFNAIPIMACVAICQTFVQPVTKIS